MSVTAKAVWAVETRLREPLTLEIIAAHAGVTPFHLSRAFSLHFGVPLMRYVRQRRLSEGARLLADGQITVLSVALEFGYGSHEAFTRAMRAEFGVTPRSIRDERSLNTITLREQFHMSDTIDRPNQTPRSETVERLVVAGLNASYDMESRGAIPSQWVELNSGGIPYEDIEGSSAYGVCHAFADGGRFEYLCGFRLRSGADLPSGWVRVDVPAGHYAVFSHDKHISDVPGTWEAIFNQWLPASGLTVRTGPEFELYGPDFDPATGEGGLEIWIPVEA